MKEIRKCNRTFQLGEGPVNGVGAAAARHADIEFVGLLYNGTERILRMELARAVVSGVDRDCLACKRY